MGIYSRVLFLNGVMMCLSNAGTISIISSWSNMGIDTNLIICIQKGLQLHTEDMILDHACFDQELGISGSL